MDDQETDFLEDTETETKQQRNHHQEAQMKTCHHVILHLSLLEAKARAKLIH